VKKALQGIHSGQINPRLIQALQRQFHLFARLQSLDRVGQFVRKYLQIDISAFPKNIRLLMDTKRDHLLTVLDRTLNLLQKERELTRKRSLSFVDYEALGRKKAPNFPFNRKEIYQIFEWYQQKLDSEHLWDELDLTREVVSLLNEGEAEDRRYDLVVCDEVQDLTDVQHELLFYLVRDPLNLLLCGDTRQIINPSGFRWEELKRHFYERELKIPQVSFLSLNFRSSGSIVELSNTLLDLKSTLLGSRSGESKEEWKYKGRPPVVVKGLAEHDMLKNVRSTGAKKTILVRTDKEKRHLQRYLDTELIFTIYEAKGLEFDTVLLWKFCNDVATEVVWKVVLQESRREAHQANIRHEVNLLYVAITRAQRDLLIYDGRRPSLIWNSDMIRGKVYATDDIAYIENIWDVISTPEEWREQGDYFFEREYYRAAMECYKNAGADGLFLKARAFDAEMREDFHMAATCFEKIGELEKAAGHFEKNANFKQALRLWKALKNRDGAFRCHLKVLEREGCYGELADEYLSHEDYGNAFDMLVRAERYEQAAEVSLKHLKDPEKAAVNYERAGRYRKAARFYQKIKNLEKAAELYERAQDFENAAKLWKRLKRQDRLVSLYHKAGNYLELLKIYEKARDFDNATKVLKKISPPPDFKAQARRLFKNRRYFPALTRFSILNDHENMAACHLKLKNYTEAGRHYEFGGCYEEAGLAYQKAKEYRRAFILFLQSKEDRRNHFVRASKVAKHLSFLELGEIGNTFFKQRQLDPAAVAFEIAGDAVMAGICHLENGQLAKPRACWQTCFYDFRLLEEIALYCLSKGQVEFGARFILKQPRYAFQRSYYSSFPRRRGQRPSPFLQMMDDYFVHRTDEKEMLKWVDILNTFEVSLDVERMKLKYMERIGDFNGYFDELNWLSYAYPRLMQPLRTEYRRRQKSLINDPSEVSAIQLFFLNKHDEFNHVVERLDPTEDNYQIFAQSLHYERAVDLLQKKGDFDALKMILVQRDAFLRLARIAEQLGLPEQAAHYYGVDGDYEKSAILFEDIGKFYKAGDAFYKIGDYRKAREMYVKSGKGKAKIARCHERLGEYAEAAEMWKELGKTKNHQKCLAKLQMKNGLSRLDDRRL